jgi:hypothetical protein
MGSRASDELEGRISQTRRGLLCIKSKHGTQLAQSQFVPDRPLLPLYIGGQDSRIQSGLIQITIFVYDITLYLITSILRTP